MSLLLILACLGFIVPTGLYLGQENLIFYGQPQNQNALNLIEEKYPESQIELITPDNVKLHGWFIQDKVNSKSPLLIYFGGNAEEVSEMALEKERFKGWSLVLINYRGYGLSKGKPTEKNLVKDALFIYDLFSQHKQVETDKIVVMGRSLGTGVATQLAAQRQLSGLILVSPYDSLINVAKFHYPMLPIDTLLKHRFESIFYAPQIKTSLLALIAENDEIIPFKSSENLLKNWAGKTITEVIPNTGHNTIGLSNKFWQAISDFLFLLNPPVKQKLKI